MVKSYKHKQNNRKGRKFSKKRKKGGANEVNDFYDSVKKIITNIKDIEEKKNADLMNEMNEIKGKYKTSKPIAQGKNGKIFAHESEDKILKIVFLKSHKEDKCNIQIGESFKYLIKKVKSKNKVGGANEINEKKKKIVEVYSKKKNFKATKYELIFRIIPELKIRHTPINYDNYKYFDMLCCLFDLRKAYNKIKKYQDCKSPQDGGSRDDNVDVINYEPAINEIVIQKILYEYLTKTGYTKSIIEFYNYYITDSEIGIEQEKIGKQMDNFYISNLAEYIEYFLIKNKNSKPDKDMLFKYILINMLGIKIDNNTDLKPFFEKLNNDTKQFIETYLVTDNLIPGSFLKILRTLYDHLRFLHLDFKMKNIFVRYKTNIDRHDEYKNFECVIGDLDKSRLQIDFNNVYINESTV